MGYTFVHPKTAQRRYPRPGKDRRGNQEWVLESQWSGSSSLDSYLYTKPHSKLQQTKAFPSQQCSQLKHCLFPLPSCLAVLGGRIQGSQHVYSVWHPAGLWSWPAAPHPALGYSRSSERMELGTNPVLTTGSYLQVLSICSRVKSYFPHLCREREVSMTCPLTWNTFVFSSMNDFLKQMVQVIPDKHPSQIPA